MSLTDTSKWNPTYPPYISKNRKTEMSQSYLFFPLLIGVITITTA